MNIWKLFLVCTLVMTHSSWTMANERPIMKISDQGEAQLWYQLDSFDPAMDFLGYQKDRPAKSAKLDSVRTNKYGFSYTPFELVNLSYVYGQTKTHVTRYTEPMSVDTRTSYQAARIQTALYRNESWLIGAEVGWNKHSSPENNVYKYDFGNIQVSWPGHVLVTSSSEDSGYLGAIRMRYENGSWAFHYGYEQRQIDVKASMTSESETVNSKLAAQAPQSEPWKEKHHIQQLGFDYTFLTNFTFSVDYQNFTIKRMDDYIPRKNKKDFNNNETLDIYAFWKMDKSITPYIHAKLSRHSTLGDDPSAYNQRTNHKFENPLGLLSLGLHIKF